MGVDGFGYDVYCNGMSVRQPVLCLCMCGGESRRIADRLAVRRHGGVYFLRVVHRNTSANRPNLDASETAMKGSQGTDQLY